MNITKGKYKFGKYVDSVDAICTVPSLFYNQIIKLVE